MISKFKTAMIAGVLAVAAVLILVPVQAQAAGKNGDGIVYHRSDCGAFGMRQYGGGGDWAGGACGYWLNTQMGQIVWSEDHNWTIWEICQTIRYDVAHGGTWINNQTLAEVDYLKIFGYC